MAQQKRRFLDVWIVETNTVYREVPFTVVSDWVQQGRLLEDDMLRPSGTAQWFKLGSMPAFAAYLPKSEPYRVEDKAEALEPVHMDFSWKTRTEEDESDVDMIPLIDVSLVLLIFFLMISDSIPSNSAGRAIRLSEAQNGGKVDPGTLWVSIQPRGDGLTYTLGEGSKTLTLGNGKDETTDRAVLLRRLDEVLAERPNNVEVRIRADRDVLCDPVMELMGEIHRKKPKVGRVYKDVGSPK